jgi:hypothetical protein
MDGGCAGREMLNGGHPPWDRTTVSMNTMISGRRSYFEPLRGEQGNRASHVK